MKRWQYTKILVGIIILGLAGTMAFRCWWPTKMTTMQPYAQVVEALHELYPIYIVKRRDGNMITMDREMIDRAKQHPAYVGVDQVWDLDVTYRDIIPGTEHEIEIVNQAKLWERKTIIRIRNQSSALTSISVSSHERTDLFIETTYRDNVTRNGF
jgi:hypothetical protein